ncbi:uncharacterized protein LOC130545917 [Triplophysa rosa]|uniref:uncharacterized protein LOC130545917 n=1 Tax=Triplophysa rosa TaxID=992332 RepID=UPI002545C2A5|nr:uncharacterized protein LOC130545917 [Triplophysa rosa]
MECDSVHSVIERRLRDQDVYLPAEYVNLMKRARVKPHPYEVKYIDHTFFQDFTKLRLCKSLRPGVRPGDPTVHNIRAIRYNNNGTMDFKIDHSDDCHPHPSHQLRNSTSDSHTVTPLYSDRLKIKELKFKHLQDLKEVIPKDFHSFYDNLLHKLNIGCSINTVNMNVTTHTEPHRYRHTDKGSPYSQTQIHSVMGLVKQALTMILSVLNYDISY